MNTTTNARILSRDPARSILETHHPSGLRGRRRTAQDREEDRREHRTVDGREEDHLRDVAERAFLLTEEEGHRLVEGDPARRAEGDQDRGQAAVRAR